jgi:hypothetical protein
MERLKQKIPNKQQPKEIHQQFAKQFIQIWLQAFHLTPEMLTFSKSELKAIDDYLYAIKLIIDCRKSAVRVNISAWEQIESRLLMPKSLHQY